MHKQSEADWAPLPTLSAFTEQEVAAVEARVRSGGSLLLIADHMPLAGHAEALAAAFGVRFHNGFAQDSAGNGQLTFRRSDGSLASNIVTNGRGAGERIDAVTTFTGQAFRLDPGVKAEALLVLPAGSRLLLPEVAFQFSERTPRIPAAHLLQGAIVHHGRGRLAVLGEAAMLTAQLAGPNKRPLGMNAPEARERTIRAQSAELAERRAFLNQSGLKTALYITIASWRAAASSWAPASGGDARQGGS